jgi:hypothetical protein
MKIGKVIFDQASVRVEKALGGFAVVAGHKHGKVAIDFFKEERDAKKMRSAIALAVRPLHFEGNTLVDDIGIPVLKKRTPAGSEA